SFDFDISSNRGEVRIDASSDFAGQVAEGRILASEQIEGVAPSGMLQRVISVREEGGELVATTRQATLAETFERADFEMSRNISPDEIQSTQSLREGVSVQTLQPEEAQQEVGQPVELSFDQVVVDTDGDQSTTDDQLRLNGSIAFGAALDTDVQIRAFKLRRFLFAMELQESVDIEMEGDFDGADIEQSVRVANVNIDTISFQIGPVPVVIKIDMIVTMGIDGSLTAEIRVGAVQSASARIGAEYTDGDGWNGINESSSDFQTPPPELSFDRVNARGWVRPQLEVKLYGVAGPFVFAEPFLRFEAEVYTSPFWELYGGLNFGAGLVVRVPVVGEVGSFEASFQAFEEDIDSSNNRDPELEIIGPEDGVTTNAGGSVTLTVDVFDRETELVDVSVTGGNADVETSVNSEGEGQITVRDLCEGVQTLTVTAQDNQGASTSETFTVVVQNAVPEVSMDASTLTGDNAQPIFPGAYVSVDATVEDTRCSQAPPVEDSLTGWYLDDARVSRTAALFTRLPQAQYSVGDTLSVQARFDDGTDVGTSQRVEVTLEEPPQGDLPAEANITECNVCDRAINGPGPPYRPHNRIQATGIGYDPKDGELSGDRLTWYLINEANGDRSQIGTGKSIDVELITIPSFVSRESPQDFTVELVVEDGDSTATDTGSFFFDILG
ncbi:MAG: hypothetical protein ACQEVA_18445, partial [Myxococcota bacterium]